MAVSRSKFVLELDLDKNSVDESFNKVDKRAKKSGKKAGKNFGKGFGTSVEGALSRIGPAALAAAASLAAAFTTRRAIQAAVIQEDAVNRLNISLARIGEFSKESSKGMQDFASQLQSTTRFGDETILQNLSLAQSLGATAEKSKEVVEVATNLSEALGVDVSSATRLVAKTLGGYAGELGEVIPAMKNFTQAQLRAGAGVKLLAEQFSGFAAQAVRTFSGATAQLGNTFGDVLEQFGFFITKSKALIGLVNGVSSVFTQFINTVKIFRGEDDFLERPIKLMIQFAGVVNKLVTPQLEIMGRVVSIIFNGMVLAIGTTILELLRLVRIGALVAKSLGSDGELFESLDSLEKKMSGMQDGSLKDLKDGFSNLADPLTMRENFDQALTTIDDFVDKAIASQQVFKNTTNKTADAVVTKMAQTGKQIAAIFNQTLTKAISHGIQTITVALLFGEDAFSNFGKTILRMMGDMAIRMGETLVLTGIGIQSLFALNGAAAIAAGAGLIALGSILKQFAGSGGAGAGGGGAGGGAGGGIVAGGLATGDTGSIEQVEEREAPTQQVSVNIEGDVFDSEETGLRIVDILSESFQREGTTVIQGNT